MQRYFCPHDITLRPYHSILVDLLGLGHEGMTFNHERKVPCRAFVLSRRSTI